MGAVLLAVLAGCVGLFLAAGTRPGPPGLPEVMVAPTGTILPLTSPGGWPRGEAQTYDAGTLFEKINGKADAYLAYDFEELRFASYTDPDGPDDAYVDVYVYVMGSALDAFGIYRSQRSGGEPVVEAGEEACVIGEAVFARQGPAYLELLASGPAAAEEARALAGHVARALPASSRPLPIPATYPTKGLRIIRFDRTSALGVDKLRDAFIGVYEDGTRAVIAHLPDAATAEAAAADAKETFEFLGEPARFEVRGAYVIGVVGEGDPSALLARLEASIPDEAFER